MKITCWRISEKNATYFVQFETESRKKTEIFNLMHGAALVGNGGGPNSYIYIFRKSFADEEKFEIWKKNFPHSIEELNDLRTCKICGSTGHNSRTCPYKEKEPEDEKKVVFCSKCGYIGHTKERCSFFEKGSLKSKKTRIIKQKKCSICGKIGHNARTCGEKAKS